ncbi:hypothetical protein SD71_04385 [Cohnella kolymensis]|uniref:DUF309 domain-containing protein n=2 Tax=Cohnella kolymensis TaxID=1590652 RepID=A0ABR5A8A8_9BACL|nr:hypothetical protein SD71_04385 [Cohnella kolymensis]
MAGDPRYLAFIAHFNGDRDYFECHEVMEELWLEEGRSPLLQGLLQAAVGLHHWNNGNLSGAVKLMTASRQKLGRYGDLLLGLDLAALCRDLDISLQRLKASTQDVPFHAFELKVVDDRLRKAVSRFIGSQG